MITYNSPNFNNIIDKIEEILKNNKIDVQDSQQVMPNVVIHAVASYIQSILEPSNKFLSVSCPKCGKIHLAPMESTYERCVIFKVRSILLKITITIPRLICGNCGGTHAALPCFCIPLKRYSKQAILSIAKEASCTTTEEVAAKLNMESKQVRRFVNLVLEASSNILQLFHMHPMLFNTSISPKTKLHDLINALPGSITQIYFEQFKNIFLYEKNSRKLHFNYADYQIREITKPSKTF